MPTYVYKCFHCNECFEVTHGMTENQHRCVRCGTQGPERVPQMPFIKREEAPEGSKVGDETKAAIEANRALLDEAKKEAKNNHYKDDKKKPKRKTKRKNSDN